MRPNAPWYWAVRDGWYVKVNGKRTLLAKGKDNKKEAELSFHLLKVNEGNAPPPNKLLVKELANIFLDHSKLHNSASTYDIYLYYLKSFCDMHGSLTINGVKPFHVTKWLDKHPTWKGSRWHAIGAVKRCFSWAADQEIIEKSPVAKVKKGSSGKRDRVLTLAEKTLLLKSITCEKFKRFVTAMLETGCRPSEIAKVTADNVDLKQGVWIFKNHKTAKQTGKPRIVYLSPVMIKLSRKQMAERPTGSLFTGRLGQAYSKNAIRCHFRRLRKKLPALKGVVAYTCRHTYATNALVNGVDVAHVAELLGHQSVDMVTSYYGHLAQQVAHMRQAAVKAVKG